MGTCYRSLSSANTMSQHSCALQQRHPPKRGTSNGTSLLIPRGIKHTGKQQPGLTFSACNPGGDFWALSPRFPPQEAGQQQQSEYKVLQDHCVRLRFPSSWNEAGNKRQGRRSQQSGDAAIRRQESLKMYFYHFSPLVSVGGRAGEG